MPHEFCNALKTAVQQRLAIMCINARMMIVATLNINITVAETGIALTVGR